MATRPHRYEDGPKRLSPACIAQRDVLARLCSWLDWGWVVPSFLKRRQRRQFFPEAHIGLNTTTTHGDSCLSICTFTLSFFHSSATLLKVYPRLG